MNAQSYRFNLPLQGLTRWQCGVLSKFLDHLLLVLLLMWLVQQSELLMGDGNEWEECVWLYCCGPVLLSLFITGILLDFHTHALPTMSSMMLSLLYIF